MRTIKIWKDPYNIGFNTTKARKIEFQEGITVLVGCNGAGKTTLLKNIYDELRKENIPVFFYNDALKRNDTMSKALFNGNYSLIGSLSSASEGEGIGLRFMDEAPIIMEFIKAGINTDSTEQLRNALTKALGAENQAAKEIQNERWLLLDSLDSGASLDNLIDLNELLDEIIKVNDEQFKTKLHIIITTNNYELSANRRCLNAMSGKYEEVKDYSAFRKLVLKTRKEKEKRYAD